MNDDLNILVLGHTGFVGRHLFASLVREFPSKRVSGVSSAEIDLAHSSAAERLRERLNERTVLIFCAAIQKWVRDDLDSFEKNMRMVCGVIRAIHQRPIYHLVYFSSVAVYGEGVTNLNMVEDTPHAPTNLYGVSKSAAERLFQIALSPPSTVKLSVLRPTLVYGEDTPDEFYLPAGFAASALQGKVIRMWGDGEEFRDYIHVDDVCALMQRIVRDGVTGTFNMASGEAASYRTVLDMVAEAARCKITIESIPRTRAKVSMVARNNRILDACGRHRFIRLAEGVKAIVEAKRARMAAR